MCTNCQQMSENIRLSLAMIKSQSQTVSKCQHVLHACGGRVVILVYCPSCFLMEIGLYCQLRQFVLRGDVNWT